LLASWYLDDGCLLTSNVVLATNGFPKEDVEFLSSLLSEKGYTNKVFCAKNKFLIRILAAGLTPLMQDIGAYIPPCMRRKATASAPAFLPNLWQLGEPVIGWDKPLILTPTTPHYEHTVYCIDVEETHNFITKAGVVHNCKPPSIEDIHWASDSIPLSRILPTVWNSLESDPSPTIEGVKKLLLEEFSPAVVEKSLTRIGKAVGQVKQRLAWHETVQRSYLTSGLTFAKDGRAGVMRELSRHFSKQEMKRVFSALKEMGFMESTNAS